jgi:hypothetical protein
MAETGDLMRSESLMRTEPRGLMTWATHVVAEPRDAMKKASHRMAKACAALGKASAMPPEPHAMNR